MEFTLTYLLLSLLKVYIQIENYQNSTHNMIDYIQYIKLGCSPHPSPWENPNLMYDDEYIENISSRRVECEVRTSVNPQRSKLN